MGRILPILFNAEMVQAILDGRKTVTRRVIKPRYQKNEYSFEVATNKVTGQRWVHAVDDEGFMRREILPPYQPGDILYVRETVWQQFCTTLDMMTGETCFYNIDIFRYCATDTKPISDRHHHWRKRPSIHMPKEAARIWLKVTDVRVERLQVMWASDVSKEGIYFDKPCTANEMLEMFATLWNSTIKKSDLARYGWDANPWVWVIAFERCEKPERSC